MQPPVIAPIAFKASKAKIWSKTARWAALATALGVSPTATSLTATFNAQDSVAFIVVAGLAWAAVVFAAWWLLQTFLWQRVRRLGAVLTLDAEGLHDRRRWRMPIPWKRIQQVRPIGRSAESYRGFVIEIAGRNDVSNCALQRWADNWIAQPLGGDPFFTLSFADLDANDREISALIREIVAVAEAHDGGGLDPEAVRP